MNARPVVVDASVAVKWFVSEEYSENALGVIRAFWPLLGPEFLVTEAGHTLLKKVRAGELTEEHCQLALLRLQAYMEFRTSVDLAVRSFEIASAHNRSVYDSLYVALALREDCQLVTADERLYNALRGVFPGTMLWIGDVPE